MNETIKIIENLQTVRSFSDRNISQEHLSVILNSCVNAATASARQTYSIIVVQDKEVMKSIGYVGAVMLVFTIDFNRIIDTAEYLGFQYKEIDVVDFITGSTDTILAAQTAAITAKSLGIDSFFSNCVHRGNISRIYNLLNLPEKYCFPLIALVLGYSSDEKEHKRTKKGRLRGPGVIHFNEYQRLNNQGLENIISEYDSPDKHFLSLIDGWSEKGYSHYLDYFYEQWCGCIRFDENTDNRVKSKRSYDQVEQMLIRTGFLSES